MEDDNCQEVTTELYNFNPIEVIGSYASNESESVHICDPVTRSTDDKGVTKWLDCPCIKKYNSLDQLRHLVSHLYFVSTRNKGVWGSKRLATDLQGRRSKFESPASGRFTCGFNLTFGINSKLNMILPEDIYKAIVQNSSSLLKVYKTVKCLLWLVTKVPRHKN